MQKTPATMLLESFALPIGRWVAVEPCDSCGNRIRTGDFQVMSLARCLCVTPHHHHNTGEAAGQAS